MNAVPGQFIFSFGGGTADGRSSMKNILGGKGANLAEMASLGIPIPPGFTISTEICDVFYKHGNKLPDSVKKGVLDALAKVEKTVGRKFGDAANPLLVSVRSGARASMPGMMDTILNLGLNDQTVQGLARVSGKERFAWDSYRRFLQMYSDVVMGMNRSLLEVAMEDLKDDRNVKLDTELTVEDLKKLTTTFKKMILDTTGLVFPMDPMDQLWGAIGSVFESWHNSRAKTYRGLHGIPEEWGTAVNIQSMVFGNLGEDSATGVAFTRNPSTGEKKFYGEFLINAQGEDVVAGIRTPVPISELKVQMPKAYQELEDIYQKLELHYKDMQDIEFTIEQNRLWMLQTRNGKRTAHASLKVALDMVKEGLISENEALLRVDPLSLDQLLHPTLDPKAEKTLLAQGLPASPGAAVGQIVFHADDAEHFQAQGKSCILVRVETSPEDISGMVAAQGILTTRGGMTSHAAVVARGMGKCCVAGCGDLFVDEEKEEVHVKGYVLKKGETITLDGSTGEVFFGAVKTVRPELGGDFQQLMLMSDRVRRLKVRANADTPQDAKIARGFGAEGIGLCRTEHMFFDPARIDIVRRMIIAETEEERREALDELLPIQKQDFMGLFKEMAGFPVTIRLLDPPLHEFVPHKEEEIQELSKRIHVSVDQLKHKIRTLHEFNPMLGHRGCRLAMTFPEIYEMQATAIAEACVEVTKAGGAAVEPEIMIPLIADKKELQIMKELVDRAVQEVQKRTGTKFAYLVGTMIELPRAAIMAGELAEVAEFFSFGTNDLTQTTLGVSRDDAGRFLPTYVARGVFEKDPFVSLDQKGVGKLVEMGTTAGRAARKGLKVGVCGEHGGDPQSIEFFHKTGLDYVSCSPFRVPIARLAAARAQISGAKEHTTH